MSDEDTQDAAALAWALARVASRVEDHRRAAAQARLVMVLALGAAAGSLVFPALMYAAVAAWWLPLTVGVGAFLVFRESRQHRDRAWRVGNEIFQAAPDAYPVSAEGVFSPKCGIPARNFDRYNDRLRGL